MFIESSTSLSHQPPAPNKHQVKLNQRLSGAYLGLVLGWGCMAGGIIGPYWVNVSENLLQ